MANKAFDSTPVYALEKALSDDINQLQSQIYFTLREVMQEMFQARASNTDFRRSATTPNGFIGNGFRVMESSPTGMQIIVDRGIGFLVGGTDTTINGAAQLNDLSKFRPILLTSQQFFVVPAADPINTRVDIVEVRASTAAEGVSNPQARQFLNEITQTEFTNPTTLKTYGYEANGSTATVTAPANNAAARIGYKVGIPGAGVPATSPGYTKIAEITIIALATTITNTEITDFRSNLQFTRKKSISFSVTIDHSGPTSNLVSVSAPPGVEVFLNSVSATLNQHTFVIQVKALSTLNFVFPTVPAVLEPSATINQFPVCKVMVAQTSGNLITVQYRCQMLQSSNPVQFGPLSGSPVPFQVGNTTYLGTIEYE